MEDLRSTVPSVVSGNLKKEDKKEVVGKVVSGAVILASIPVEVINAKINKKLPTSELKPSVRALKSRLAREEMWCFCFQMVP